MSKPEPIRVGVEGIAPKPIELTPERPRIDWAHLFGLPPFQMYAIERAGKSPSDFEAWLPGFMQEQGAKLGEQGLFDDYCQWHTAKGYWPTETPLGYLKDGMA